MRTYTLHVPAGALPGDPGALDRAVLVRDGFSWGAFLLTVAWFLAHRLFLAALGVAAALGVLALALTVLRVSPPAGFAAGMLLCWLIGLEASSLRRWTLARRGRPAVDAVLAASRDEAEAKTFQRWLSAEGGRPQDRPAGVLPAGGRPAPAVIGLFPEAEIGR